MAPNVAGAVLGSCGSGRAHGRWTATGARLMCASSASVAENSGTSSSAVDLSAGDLALGAQIKAKGDAIRELKAGGASKDDLMPHIEVT